MIYDSCWYKLAKIILIQTCTLPCSMSMNVWDLFAAHIRLVRINIKGGCGWLFKISSITSATPPNFGQCDTGLTAPSTGLNVMMSCIKFSMSGDILLLPLTMGMSPCHYVTVMCQDSKLTNKAARYLLAIVADEHILCLEYTILKCVFGFSKRPIIIPIKYVFEHKQN